MEKSELRKIYKQKRFSLKSKEINTRSELIAENFIKNLLPKIPNFHQKKLAFYMTSNNEVDPTPIIHHVAKSNLIALPKIVPGMSCLIFKKYQIGDELEENILYRNLLEPKWENEAIAPDIIFAPLVAFDKDCNRLGMGGGFYDSTINRIRENEENNLFIGLAYDIQECEKIPTNDMDQKLDFIVCEKNIFSSKEI